MKKVISIVMIICMFISLAATVGFAQAATNTKSGTASDIVAVAKAQKDDTPGDKYIKWYWNDGKKHNWCAAFVSWCANKAGAKKAISKNASCSAMYKAVIKAGGKEVSKPKPGDLIFYRKNSAGKNEFCHVGIVTKVTSKNVYTVQGNVDNKVCNTIKANKYQISNNDKTKYNYKIVYVRPKYNEPKVNTTSAAEIIEVENETTESVTSSTTTTTTKPTTVENKEEKLVSGGKYYIVNKKSGRSLDVYGKTTSSTNKSNVQICNLVKGTKSSQFKITVTSKGWYSVVPVSNTKLAVNPYSSSPKNGTNVNVYTKDTTDKTQGWYFEKLADDNAYIIRNAYNKKLVLTADGTSNMSNVSIATYKSGDKNQIWKLVAV